MKNQKTRPWFVYVFALVAMIYSLGQFNSIAWASEIIDDGGAGGRCCYYSSDCPGDELCYDPSGGLRECAPNLPGYCKAASVE